MLTEMCISRKIEQVVFKEKYKEGEATFYLTLIVAWLYANTS